MRTDVNREKLTRYKEFQTCEGDKLFLVGNWRELHEKEVDHTNTNYYFGSVFEDGDTEWQDNKRILRYFWWQGRTWPLTEFGIDGNDYSPQIISFFEVKIQSLWGRMKKKKTVHFINGYCMDPGMNWMLIEIDVVKNRVRVFECDPDCKW